jgi:large subunit ribosomal protein L18
MNSTQKKKNKRVIRHNRVRAKISGTAQRPRLAVFRANQHIYAQVIDDQSGTTLAAASSREVKDKADKSGMAAAVGKLIAGKALAKNINQVVFDRGGYQYHGRVKALAEAAREGGLQF